MGRHIAVRPAPHEVRSGLPQLLDRPLLVGRVEVREDPAEIAVRSADEPVDRVLHLQNELAHRLCSLCVE
jgi:hypothetical protein